MRPLDPRLLRYARASRMYLLASVVLGVLTAGLIVAQAWLLATAISSLFPTRRHLDLDVTLGLLALTVAARAGLGWAQDVAAHRTAASVKTELRQRLLAKVTALGPGWLTRQRSGSLATVTGHGLDALDAYFSRYLPQLVLAALIPVIVLAQIIPADLIAAVTIVVTLPLIPIFMILIGLHTERTNRRQFRLLTRLSHHFLDVVSGLGTLTAYRRVAAQERTIRQVTDEYRRVTLRTLRVAFLSALALELLATLSVAMVAVGIGLRLISGALDFRTALLVLILAPEAYLPIRQVGAHFHAAAEGLAAAEEVFAVLETPDPAVGTGTALPPVASSPLRLSGLTVQYPQRPHPVFEGLDLTVSPGEMVALTGPSGCGKSTVLAAVLGFVAPVGGSVSIGGVDLATVDPAVWRRQVAWVPQRPWLFAGTVADNIRLGRPDAPEAEVRAAAEAVGVTTFVDALPEGWNTRLSDGGRGLSAGQRQRIALARAFLRDAPVLLLDEPTANLDGETEAAVLSAVLTLSVGRTVLLAAHRPALVAMAHREIRLDATEVPA